jgi:hypothetical protein
MPVAMVLPAAGGAALHIGVACGCMSCYIMSLPVYAQSGHSSGGLTPSLARGFSPDINIDSAPGGVMLLHVPDYPFHPYHMSMLRLAQFDNITIFSGPNSDGVVQNV